MWVSAGATGFFIALDLLLVLSCSTKFVEGGWFPVVLAAGFLVLMTSWNRGRELLHETLRAELLRLPDFVQAFGVDSNVVRVDRTAVFLSAEPNVVPQALLHNMKHNLVLHKRNVVLTLDFREEPFVPEARRCDVHDMGFGFWQVDLHFGFMDKADVPAALALCARHGLRIDLFSTSFFLSRETVVPRGKGGMARWRQNLFETMSRNSGRAVDYFGIPSNAVIELGTRVQL
jgi:KUP system potassium uptake protein